MSEEKSTSNFQKEQAIQCFNKTWDYIDKPNRTPEEDLEMIHCAHASRYLWGQVGTPLHFERGEWLISKVYYLIGSGNAPWFTRKPVMTFVSNTISVTLT